MKSSFRFLILFVVAGCSAVIVVSSSEARDGLKRRRVYNVVASDDDGPAATAAAHHVRYERNRMVAQHHQIQNDIFLAENEELLLRELNAHYTGSMAVSSCGCFVVAFCGSHRFKSTQLLAAGALTARCFVCIRACNRTARTVSAVCKAVLNHHQVVTL